MRDAGAAGAQPGQAAAPRKSKYTLDISGDSDWTDSGLVVSAGETISIGATGTLALPDSRSVTPDGTDRGWKDLLRQFPLNGAKTGALIGRVSNNAASVPFAIGAKADSVMPTSGALFLRANLSSDLAGGTGGFKVTVRPSARAAVKTASAVTPSNAPAIATLVSPDLFADIPRRVGDESNNAGDMVNFALVGTEAQIKAAYKAAGWVAVDKTTQDAVLHGLMATLNHEAYLQVPMSTLYLFGRPQDLSYARADPLKVAAERHHLRVWRSTQMVDGRPLWVGSATHDIGFEKDQRNGKVTHKIDPEIDNERKFLLDSFDASGAVSSAAYVTPADPLREASTATGGSFHSDGRIVVMALTPDLK